MSYPEWFVGGPWHGEDKMIKCPQIQGRVEVAIAPPISAIYGAPLDDPLSGAPGFERMVYEPVAFGVFGRRLTVWVSQGDRATINGGQGARYEELIQMIGDLIMSPHVHRAGGRPGTGAEMVDEFSRQARSNETLRRQITAEVDLQYRTRIADLSARLARAERGGSSTGTPVSPPRHLSTPEGWIYRTGTFEQAARIEIKEAEDWHGLQVDRVTTYLDDGDAENPPAWVATAQADAKTITGYGTTPKAAILAMLADGLDVYARMIDTSEKPRIR